MRHPFSVWLGVVGFAAALLAWPGMGQAGLEEDIADLREELGEIRKELAEIKSMLQTAFQARRPATGTAEVRVAGRPSLGRNDAPVTIVEFSDYQCPFCKRHARTVLPALKTEYIDTGKVRYVFRDFPIDGLHPQARKGHEAALCAGEQNKYWQMHDLLFEKSDDFSVPALKRYAADLGLNPDQFANCLQGARYAGEVDREIAEGSGAGVRGTPSFFIGPSAPGEKITGTLVVGAQPLARFKQVIQEALSKAAGDAATPAARP